MRIAKRGHLFHRAAACLLAVTLVAPVLATTESAAAGVPSDFEDSLVATISQAIDLAWTPSGQMLVPAKGGELWIVENDSVLPTPAIDLSGVICADGERGLLGVAVHPSFTLNRFVYLYYTFEKFGTCDESAVDGPVNRLSRFVLPPSNVIDPASELVLLDTSPLPGNNHNSGDIDFGPDGFVYATIGDGQNPGRAGDADNLFGKMVRLTDDGDIPAGNPFVGPNGVRCNVDGEVPSGSPPGAECEEIFALGLRNPFRFALDPESPTTRFFVNDVGQGSWEEIDEVTSGGDDFGWNDREGPCSTSSSSCAPDPAFTDPVHWYEHSPSGAAITGGAFVPDGVWPSQYQGTYLFADFVFDKIFRLDPGGPDCRLCDPPTSAFVQTEFADASRVVAMAFGPHQATQALYYVTFDNEVRRIVYTGPTRIVPGVAVLDESEAGTATLDIPVTLDIESTETVTAQWTTYDLTATGGTDYEAATGQVVFAPGDTEEIVSVTVIGDIEDESDESLIVGFTNPTNAAIGGFYGLGFGTILDDDPPPVITPRAVAVIEGDTPDTTVVDVPVTMSNPSSEPVTVEWETLDTGAPGVATADVDYLADSGIVTFAPGETMQTVPISVVGDNDDEPPLLYGEWGLIQFSNPSANASLDTDSFFGAGLFVIVDDDE